MADDPSESVVESPGPSLSLITQKEVQSKAFRPFLTLLMNAFRNQLFKVVKGCGELELSSSLVGSHPSLLSPDQTGAADLLGSCRKNIHYAICVTKVFEKPAGSSKSKQASYLSGDKAAEQLYSFIAHHLTRNPRVLSAQALLLFKPIVESFCRFLKMSLADSATLDQFRMAIEVKYRSDPALWAPHTDSTCSPARPVQKTQAGEKRKRSYNKEPKKAEPGPKTNTDKHVVVIDLEEFDEFDTADLQLSEKEHKKAKH